MIALNLTVWWQCFQQYTKIDYEILRRNNLHFTLKSTFTKEVFKLREELLLKLVSLSVKSCEKSWPFSTKKITMSSAINPCRSILINSKKLEMVFGREDREIEDENIKDKYRKTFNKIEKKISMKCVKPEAPISTALEKTKL